MITAKDIHKKKFEKVKFGYSPEEVDSFLAQLENDLRLMQQNLDESNDKVQLLADKVREYKETEDDLKNALLGAQKQAREVIADAEAKAAQITAEAQASVDSVKSEALLNSEEQLQAVTERVEAQKAALAETKQQVASFKQALFDLYKQHLEMIASIPEDDGAFDPVPAAEAETPAADAPAETAAETVEAEIVGEQPAADPFGEVAAATFESRRDQFN
ncbi:MAG TPA: cell division initiation protein [Ruminococcus sp.]|nr:cell division initiation protein [Ruminococcus sp.]